MSTTRSTTIISTTFMLNKSESPDKRKKSNFLESNNIHDSKIIFVKTNTKNRNLSKSLEIRYPFEQEKLTSNLKVFSLQSDLNLNLKPILKNSFSNKYRQNSDKALSNSSKDCGNNNACVNVLEDNHQQNNKNKNVDSGAKENIINQKKIKFADEVSVIIEEDEKILDIKSDGQLNLNFFNSSENVNNNKNKNQGPLINSDKSLDEAIVELDRNNNVQCKETKKLLNQFIEQENKKYFEISNNSPVIKNTMKRKKLPLAEVIAIPSYRNYNIYRTNSKDLLRFSGRDETNKAQCKCCVIF